MAECKTTNEQKVTVSSRRNKATISTKKNSKVKLMIGKTTPSMTRVA